jgi:hypothetical protein
LLAVALADWLAVVRVAGLLWAGWLVGCGWLGWLWLAGWL